MTRKFIALLLVISLLFCMFPGCAKENSTITEMQIDGYDISLEENREKRTASTIVEGIAMKCEYLIDTNEYWLYLDDEPIKLRVNTLENGDVEVFASEEWTESSDEVIGQFALTLSFAVPALIAAAKALVCAVACVAATATICVSANALGNVIGGIKNNTKTYYRYREYDATAADAIRFGRMKKYNTCYKAYLSGNTVMIGQEITEWEAIMRMTNGYDIFATSAYVAGRVANSAATYKGVFNSGEAHAAHRDGEYPHYHAFGRRWYKNRAHSPHAWYPF